MKTSKYWLYAGLLCAAGLLGCSEPELEDSTSCNPSSYVVSCKDGMRLYCNSMTHKIDVEFCTCNAAGTGCEGVQPPAGTCDPLTYVPTCMGASRITCVAGTYASELCSNGCANGVCLPAGETKQCDPATFASTCANGVLTSCNANGTYKTETCANGCNTAGNACGGGTTPQPRPETCPNGPGSKKAGDTYNQFVYTGCACDEATYQKTCGTVDGKSVAYTCYKGDEEYLPCDQCRIEGGRYECGAEVPTTPTTLERGNVTPVDAEYAELGIKKEQMEMEKLEKSGDEQVIHTGDKFTTEACGALTASGSDVCSRTGSSTSKYVIQGDILTKDKIYTGGSVVVEGNKITYVGCSPDTSNATVITCANAVVSAGLINAHEHITYDNATPNPAGWGAERYEHRNHWRKGIAGHKKVPGDQTSDAEVAELRHLMGGATSVFGSGKYAGLLRNVDKEKINNNPKGYPEYQTFPVGDSGGKICNESTTACGCGSYKYTINKNYYFGPHIGEGINDYGINEFMCLQQQGLFSNKLAVIHGVAATPAIIRDLAKAGSTLIWSPRSNVSLYGDTARVTVYDNMGVTIALGTDWIYSGSGNMLREYQCADFLNAYYFDHHFSDYDLWMMGTWNAAVALGLDPVIGDLAAGKMADIAVFAKNGRSEHRAVLEAENKDVALVMIDGKLAMGDANIMTSGQAVTVGQVSKKVDTKATGAAADFNTISKTAKYALFFEGTPKNEPICVPMRTRTKDTTDKNTTLYDGQYSDPKDQDGDGIPDSVDNCPTVFNPVRPEDKDKSNKLGQGDWDGDGIGDVCDTTPIG